MTVRKWFASFICAGLLTLGAGTVFAETTPLFATVNNLYGAPYKSSGATPSGFDCSGFTSYVFKKLGVNLPHSSAAQYKFGAAVDRDDLRPGDLVFFNTSGHGISHVGIYIGGNTFVHSESGIGVVKSRLDDPYYWSKRYVGAKRIPIPANKTE